MKAHKVLTLLFIIFNLTIHHVIPAAQKLNPNQDIAATMHRLQLEQKDEDPEATAFALEAHGDQKALPEELKIPLHWKSLGYKSYESPEFTRHLTNMTSKEHHVSESDVNTALDAISEEELCASFPMLAQATNQNIKQILATLLFSYTAHRIDWHADNHFFHFHKDVTFFWCSPCEFMLEADRFILILQQLNDILHNYPELQNNPDTHLVITEFAECGCLQILLLLKGLISLGYCNTIINLITDPDATFFNQIITMAQKLCSSNANIIFNGYTPTQHCKITVKNNEFSIDDIVSYPSEPGTLYEQVGITPPAQPRLFEHVAYWSSLLNGTTRRSHCISITDPGIDKKHENFKQLIKTMMEQFCEVARHGAQNSEKTLVYSLKRKLYKYNFRHENFFFNVVSRLSSGLNINIEDYQ